MKEISGIITAIITPLNNDLSIKEKAFRKLIDYLIDCGSDGFYICGSTGEGLILNSEIRKTVLEILKDHIGDRKIIMTHVGSMNTNDPIELARHAYKSKSDCIASIPPIYYKYDFKAIYNYYKRISDAAKLPLFIYNIPVLTGITIDFDRAQKLSKIKNIIGIKYSDNDIADMTKMKSLKNDSFKIFFGQDGILAAGLMMGADGGIGGSYNIMCSKYKAIYEAVRNNDWKTAVEIQYKIIKYRELIFRYGSNISAFKTILSNILDIDMGEVTSPLRNLTKYEKKKLISELSQSGFFDFIK